MTHPSIEGLREAVGEARQGHGSWRLDRGSWRCACGSLLVLLSSDRRVLEAHERHINEFILDAQAAYLTEHGVGWFGEGLVRAEELTREHTKFVSPPFFALVPVPQDGET